MRYKINYKNLNQSQEIEDQIVKKIQKIEKLVPTFPDDAVSFQVSIEKHARREEYNTSMTLHFPQSTLHAERREKDHVISINGAFHELERQMKKFKSKLNRGKPYNNKHKQVFENEEIDTEVIDTEDDKKNREYV